MSVRKFTAPTARMALREIRDELGEDAVILSNRSTPQGVEILALANEDIKRMTGKAVTPPERVVAPVKRPVQAASRPVQAASTESASPARPVATAAAAHTTGNEHILDEIKSMHSMLQQQISTMSWNDALQRDPHRAALLRRMLNAGFSTALAHRLIEKMPTGMTHSDAWLKQVLKRNLQVSGEHDDIVAQGGVYALIGPTGVGKTTTTAKLAARAVVRYGADKVALLTTDGYRIGAYEQLKIYGKILGVAVHAVKDTEDLRLTLSALRHKHLVLIDTVGMGQRDERVAEQNEMFDVTGVKRLLLLNSTGSGETLEDVVRMYHSRQVIGCIATKLDEAVNLGAMLDVVVRHRLTLHYMANGQRVPEDLHPVNPDYLIHRAIKPAEQQTAFSMQELDFPILMAAEGSAHRAGAPTSGVNSVQPPAGNGLPTFGVLLAGAAEGSAQRGIANATGVGHAR